MTLHDDARMQATQPDPDEHETERPWLSMDIAPRDRRINLRAERWIAGRECMRTEIFQQCLWSPGGTARQPSPWWKRLPPGWTPTHWREVDPIPDA